jgi:uncharacterized membrane protein
MLLALLIATVCLYSFGHWIGGTVLLLLFLYATWEEANDPTGFKRYVKRLRGE